MLKNYFYIYHSYVIEMKQADYINKIEEITSSYDFLYVIATIMFLDFCGPIEDLATKDMSKHFNYNEASFLLGMWIKNSKQNNGKKISLELEIENLRKVMEELHVTFITEGPEFSDLSTSASEFMTNGHTFKEAFFYASTGAYDYQYISRLSEKYRYDEKWLVENKRFSIAKIESYFGNIKSCIQRKLNDPGVRENIISGRQTCVDFFSLTRDELILGDAEFEHITSLFLIEPFKGSNAGLKQIGDYNEFESRPIIKLNENRYFIPQPFFLAQAIYESPFYWMNGDDLYKDKALQNRGKVAEEIVYNLFSKVFGRGKAYKGVIVNDKKNRTISDIDVIGVYEDIAIVAQVKSKKLTTLSKQGNIEKIKQDFGKAIEAAFMQGIECKKAMLSPVQFNFISETSEDLNGIFLDVKKVHIVCVVLDVYPAITHSSHILLYDKFEESTICFSAFDLEVICRYLSTPNKLTDYFSKRITNCRYYYAENELCYLGYYLEKDLKKHEKYNGILVDNDYGCKIDRMYYPEIAGLTEPRQNGKIGRNEKCPCGSNLKYKNCHGKGR